MNKKMITKIRGSICALLSLLLAFGCFTVCCFAEGTYITDIALATGENAVEKLESNGYTALFQGMNLVTDSGSLVFLGYKKGTDAITDLVVSGTKASSFMSDGIKYTLVSETDLNYGTSGTPLYLYYTKDKEAGDGITSLDTVSGFSGTDEIVVLKNDGSSPVRTKTGKAANLDDGIDNCKLYLLMYRGGVIRQYISDAVVAEGNSAAGAIGAAAAAGCDYYLDCDLDSGSSVAYIAYSRTSSKADALTGITLEGTKLTKEKKENAETFLIDISAEKLFGDSFTVGDWAGVYAASDSTISRSSPELKTLLSDKDKCSCVGTGGIYALYLGTFTGAVTEETVTSATEETSAETVTSLTETVTESAAETETAAEDLTDEYADISKEESTEESTVEEETVSASVFGGGSLRTVLIFVAVIIAAVAVFVIFRKRRMRKNEKDS